MASANSHLVDEFELAFQNCLSPLTNQEFFNVNDNDETIASVDQTVQKFLDVAKQLEAFFLQRRFLLSIHKPEQVIKEDIQDLRAELQRKDALIAKHNERLQQWQAMLSRTGSGAGQPQPTPQQVPQQAAQPPPQPQPQPTSHHQMGQQQQPMVVPQPQAMPPPPPQGTYPQGPLAFLEQTTSNIGMPERR